MRANECRHIKTSGGKCHAAAVRGTPFCYFHTRLHQSAKQPPAPTPSIDIPLVFEDRCELQLAICQVLRALVSESIDRGTASTLLYGLQLASQSIDKGSWAIPIDVVEDITRTGDGEVLAATKPVEEEDCEECDEDEDDEEDEEESCDDEQEEQDGQAEEEQAEDLEQQGDEAGEQQDEGDEEDDDSSSLRQVAEENNALMQNILRVLSS